MKILEQINLVDALAIAFVGVALVAAVIIGNEVIASTALGALAGYIGGKKQ